MNTHIKDFAKKGFVVREYTKDIQSLINNSVISWKDFCNLPLEIKQGFPYSNGADGVGYEIKEGNGFRADRKENFDMTILGSELIQNSVGVVNNPTVDTFFRDITKLINAIKPIVVDFAKQIEAEYGLPHFAQEIDESSDRFFIRFLHYFGDRETGEEIALPHVDQSGFTLHLFESAKGLQCLNYDGMWTDVPVGPTQTVIIPAMQMQLRSQGKIQALCHRVVASADTTVKGRYSAVCFVQFKNTLRYDKAKFGRLQEKEPGFNYGLSSNEFSKLFR